MKSSKSKTEIFKKLIKECVREVLKEELPIILMEINKPHNDFIKDYSPSYLKEFKPFHNPGLNPKINPKMQKLDPIQKILKQTAQSMTSADYANLGMGATPNNSLFINNTPNVSNLGYDIGEIEEWSPSSNINLPDFNQ